VGAGAARTDAAAVTAGGHRRGESGELASASGRKSSGEGAMGSAALWTWGWVRRTRVRDAGKVVAQGTAAWGAVGCACLVTGGCGPAACWSWSEASHCHVACLFFQWIFFVCSANGETKREKRDVLSRSDWTARMFRCCLRISNELGVRACRQEIDKPGDEDHSCLKRDVNVLYQY